MLYLHNWQGSCSITSSIGVSQMRVTEGGPNVCLLSDAIAHECSKSGTVSSDSCGGRRVGDVGSDDRVRRDGIDGFSPACHRPRPARETARDFQQQPPVPERESVSSLTVRKAA